MPPVSRPRKDAQSATLEALSKDQPRTVDELAVLTGYSRRTIYAALTLLVTAGQAQRGEPRPAGKSGGRGAETYLLATPEEGK